MRRSDRKSVQKRSPPWARPSHPPVPLSSAHADHAQVKSPSKRKLIKSGRGVKNWSNLKVYFCINRFSLWRWQGTSHKEWGRTERLQGWGEMWIRASERGQLKPYWGPSLWHHHGPFSGSAALRPQRGYFSFIYSISCHVDPSVAPVPLPNCPVFMAATTLATKTLHGDIVASLLLFFSCVIRVREPGNLSTNRKLSNLWICEGFFQKVWELRQFKKCFSVLGGKLLQLFNLWPTVILTYLFLL